MENISFNVDEHKTLVKYRDTMRRLIVSLFPQMSISDVEDAINYSISKRVKNQNIKIRNTYTNKSINITLLEMCDYIALKEPIVTAYGVLFKKHDVVPNPLARVIDGFLSNRKIAKKEMFKYPKGSEMFERLNLKQNLLKLDANSELYAHPDSKDLVLHF